MGIHVSPLQPNRVWSAQHHTFMPLSKLSIHLPFIIVGASSLDLLEDPELALL